MASSNEPKDFSVVNPTGAVVCQGRVYRVQTRVYEKNGNRRKRTIVNKSYAIDPSSTAAVFRQAAQTGLLLSCGGEQDFLHLLGLVALARQENLRLDGGVSVKQNLRPIPAEAKTRSFYVSGGTQRVLFGRYCPAPAGQGNLFWADSGCLGAIFQGAKPSAAPIFLGDGEELRSFLNILIKARGYHEVALFLEKTELRYGGGVEPFWKKALSIKNNGC